MALLIGTFWTLLRMLWLDHSCVLRQFLGQINHCWRFPMFSTQSTTVLKLLLHCNHFARAFLLIKPLRWSPLPQGSILIGPFFTGNKCLTQVGIYVFFIWSLFSRRSTKELKLSELKPPFVHCNILQKSQLTSLMKHSQLSQLYRTNACIEVSLVVSKY